MVSLILLSIRLKERQLSVRTNRNSCYLVRLTVTANIKIVLVVAYKECLIDHFLSCHLKQDGGLSMFFRISLTEI